MLLVLRQLEGDLALNVVKIEGLHARTWVFRDINGYRLLILQLNANLKEGHQAILRHHMGDVALDTLHLKTLERTQLRQVVEALLE